MSNLYEIWIFVDIVQKFIIAILWTVLTIILIIRIVKIIKWQQYIDWVLMAWWMLWLLTLFTQACLFVYFWTRYFTKVKLSRIGVTIWVITDNVIRVFFYGFWLMSILYPILLMVYSSQLRYLNQGHLISVIKKKINFIETSSIIAILLFIVAYFVIYNTIEIIAYKKDWIYHLKNENSKFFWKAMPWINYSQYWIDAIFFTALLIMHVIIYKKLTVVMKTRLHYFYQMTKRKINVLYISGMVYYFFKWLFNLLYIIFGRDLYNSYKFNYHLPIAIYISLLILEVPTIISLFIYWYFSTKHIDFVLYVKAWMIGYQIYHKFDNMSNLITNSCFYKNIEDSDEESEINYRPSLDQLFQSILEEDKSKKSRFPSSELNTNIVAN